MTQEQRYQLINIIITGQGDGTIDRKMAKELKKMALRDLLRAKQIKRREEDQRAREEAAEALYLADIANHGHFCMVVWSRDCDMVEKTHLGRYHSVSSFLEDQRTALEWADGPITWTYISLEGAEDFESSERDLIMENRENGGDGFHLLR